MSDIDADPETGSIEADHDEHLAQVQAQTQIREIFQALIKHGRTTRLYGAAHHHTVSFLEAFVDGLAHFLTQHEMLMVEVEPDQLIYNGKQVLSSDSHGELLIYGLYSEGARAIGVDSSAPREELQGLAELLSRDWTRRTEFDDDLIAAAWRREFTHVHIDVADRFSEEDEFGDAVIREDVMLGRGPGGTDSKHARGDSVLIPEIQGLLAELEAEASESSNAVRLKQDEAALFLSLQDDLRNSMSMGSMQEPEDVLTVEAGTQTALEREVATLEEGKDVSLELAGSVVFEVIRQDGRESQVGFMVRQVARHCSVLCAEGDIVGAAALMRRLLLICDRRAFPDFQYEKTVRRSFGSFIQEANRRRLLASLPLGCQGRENQAALFTILSILGREQLPELVRFGADLKEASLRQIVADVVIELVNGDEEALLTLLVTGEEAEAIVPILALGRLESPACVEECLKRMGDPNEDVREASLRALRGQQSPRIRQEVLRCLKDDVPSIRIEALRYLAVYRDRIDLPLIEKGLLNPELGGRDEDEIKAWIISYGIIGRIDAIKLLRSVLEKKDELSVPLETSRPHCLQALLAMGIPEAQAALDLLGRKDPELKDEIRRMSAMRRSGR